MPLATTVVFELALFPFKSAAKLFLEKHDCDTASNVELVWHAWKFFHMLFLIIGISFSNILSQMQSNTFVRNAVILLVYFCCSLSRQSKFPTRWVRVGNASCKLQAANCNTSLVNAFSRGHLFDILRGGSLVIVARRQFNEYNPTIAARSTGAPQPSNRRASFLFVTHDAALFRAGLFWNVD